MSSFPTVNFGNQNVPMTSATAKIKPSAAANGLIDASFHQGQIGDCALLTSLFSISQSEGGADLIKDAVDIVRDEKGNITSYEITFGGNNETYTITQEELSNAKTKDENGRLYSYGDDDVTLFELAFEKAFQNSKDPTLRALVDNYASSNKDDKLNGVNPASVAYLLTGDVSNWLTVRPEENKNLTKYLTPNRDIQGTDINGNDITLQSGHYYSITLDRDKNGQQLLNALDVMTQENFVFKPSAYKNNFLIPNMAQNEAEVKKIFSEFSENKDNTMLVFATTSTGVSATDGRETPSVVVKGADGEDVTLYAPHAYSVSDVQGDVVTLVNPHDTAKPLQVSLESLLGLKTYHAYSLDLSTEKTDAEIAEGITEYETVTETDNNTSNKLPERKTERKNVINPFRLYEHRISGDPDYTFEQQRVSKLLLK